MSISQIYRKINVRIDRVNRRRRYTEIYQRCRGNTMIPESIFYENLQIAEMIREVPGCIVECGVWRGGMSAALYYLFEGERTHFLFDSFEGLPPAREIDGLAALRWQNDTDSPEFYDNCRASSEEVYQTMNQTGAKDFHIIEGWFDKVLPGYKFPQPIALLRLDADWYDSTTSCLENLFDWVTEKGIIIIDDYYAWDGCSRAVHDFLSRHSALERIRSWGRVAYMIKSKG